MYVMGCGPVPCKLMLIGEAPGAEEDKCGKPFVGAGGQELTRLLHEADISRSDCYVTNLVKTRPPGNRDPLPEEIARHEMVLRREINEVNPQIIAGIGRFATSWLLGRQVDITDIHGVAELAMIEGVERAVLPVVHPAAGLHAPEQMQLTWWDLQQLGRLVRGEIEPIRDSFPSPNYREIQHSESEMVYEELPVAIDTEGWPGNMWGMSFSQVEGEGFVLRDVRAIERFVEWLHEAHRGPIVLHNAMHDIHVLDAAGFPLPTERVVDTMVMAYNLRVEPQGLKPLARRHGGMAMSSYAEVTEQADRRIARRYLERVLDEGMCVRCEGWGERLTYGKTGKVKYLKCETCEGDGTLWRTGGERLEWTAGKAKIYKPTGIGRRVRNMLKTAGEDVDYRKRWMAIEEIDRAEVEAAIGRMPEATLDDIDEDVAIRYSARDADATIRVYNALVPRIDDAGVSRVSQLDMTIIPAIARMEQVGIRIDRQHFADLHLELEQLKHENLRKLRMVAGYDVNPSSSPQVAELLYNQLGGVSFKRTKSGSALTTDNKTLEAIKLRQPEDGKLVRAIDAILGYRQAEKIDGTYATAIPLLADANDRVHTRWKMTRTETGRLASASPNLQNVPAKSALGLKIRYGFIAAAGKQLGSWDYDQIEMRLLAIMSMDENLLRVFREGLDIHAMTASLVFRVPIEEVSKSQRRAAKTTGFGVVYGMSAKGLQEQLASIGIMWSLDECEHLIDMYLNTAYPGVGAWMAERKGEARRHLAVRDLFGRVRYLPAAGSSIPRLREEALRQAGNMPIQATAAGVLKMALADCYQIAMPGLRKAGIEIDCLLNVHDELVFEFDEGEDAAKEVDAVIGHTMQTTMARWGFSTPIELTASGKCGSRWGELK